MIPRPVWLVLAATLLVWMLVAHWGGGKYCSENEYTGEEKCAQYNTTNLILIEIADALNHNEGTVVGIGTVFVALFTWLLARSTDALKLIAEGQERSTKALEAPFLIPEIVEVRDIVLDRENFNGLIPRCTYRLRNHGRTPAILIASQDMVRFIRQLPDSENEAWPDSLENHGGLYIPIGVHQTPIQERTGVQFVNRLADSDLGNLPIAPEQGRLYLLGRMKYKDLFGTEYVQAFCFQIVSWDIARVEGSVRPAPVWLNVAHVTTGDTVYNYRIEKQSEPYQHRHSRPSIQSSEVSRDGG